jgi:hypothetical protein
MPHHNLKKYVQEEWGKCLALQELTLSTTLAFI